MKILNEEITVKQTKFGTSDVFFIKTDTPQDGSIIFNNKDLLKKYGAKWDGVKKLWFWFVDKENPQKFRETNKIQCKSCYSKSNSNYYKNLPEEKKKEKINNQKKWQNNNIIRVRVLAAKYRAKRKNLEFNIDEDYINELLIKQNYRCIYTNTELDLKMGSDDMFINPNTISIDRINNKLGYTKNNVALVTAIVNNMKNDLTESKFLEVINLIQKNYKKNF